MQSQQANGILHGLPGLQVLRDKVYSSDQLPQLIGGIPTRLRAACSANGAS